MKTPAEKATELYSIGCDRVMSGGAALRGLASHLVVMVNGNSEYAGGLWRERAWPDRTITLERFEDYLLKPVREGLGIPDLAWLLDVLEAHPEKDERTAAIAAVVSEIPDFIGRAEKQKGVRNRSEIDAAGKPGAPVGNQNAAKGEENKWTNCPVDCASKRKRKSQNSPERIIARLKRDAASDPHAEALLGSIEAGDIKPYRAAVEMGWVKPQDPAVVIEKNYSKLDVKDQVMLWEQWGRALPEKSVDRVAIAVEALLNCTEHERRQAWKRVKDCLAIDHSSATARP